MFNIIMFAVSTSSLTSNINAMFYGSEIDGFTVAMSIMNTVLVLYWALQIYLEMDK